MNKTLSYFLIFLICAGLGIFYRCYPLYGFSSNDATEKATLLVIAQIRNNVERQIAHSYQNIPKTEKEMLAKQLFDDYLKRQSTKVQQQIRKVSHSIGKGQSYPYLLESDPYYFYDLTKHIKETGKISDEVKGSKYYNPKMLYPKGFWEPLNLNPYIGYYTYKTLSVFNPNISLMEAVRYTPIIIFSLSLIVFLLICANLNLSILSSSIASVLFVLAPIYIKRSALGWYDSDPYNILFPLLLTWILFLAFRHLNNKKHQIFCGISLAVTLGAYSLFWHGWMFAFGLICLSLIFNFVLLNFIQKDKPRSFNLMILFSTFIGAGAVTLSFIFGLKDIFVLFKEGWIEFLRFTEPQLSLWPNIFMSVSELKQGSIKEIISFSGGWLACLTVIIFVAFSIIKRRKNLKFYLKEQPFIINTITTLLIFWLLAIVLSFSAQRFTLFCLAPLCLLLGFCINQILNIFQNAINQKTNQKPLAHKMGTLILYVIVMIYPLSALVQINREIPSLLDPIFNDTWNKALTEVKEKTPSDSVVYSWWAPGHFIKAIAERSVIFDGATINIPQAYWMSNLYLSTNEKQALGIIRMLNTSGNDAAEFLQSKKVPLSTAVTIIKNITQLNKTEAGVILLGGLKDPALTKQILDLTHGEDKPTYILLYSEFVENNIQLSFFGKWDFKKIESLNQSPKELSKIPSAKSKAYVDFVWDMVGGPYKYSGTLAEINKKDDIVFFDKNIQIDVKNIEAYISHPQYGTGKPFSIFYLDEKTQTVKEKIETKSNLKYSIVLLKEKDHWSCILMDRPLAESLLVKLYFFKGKGLKHFEPLIEESDLTKRTTIQVYKVNWQD